MGPLFGAFFLVVTLATASLAQPSFETPKDIALKITEQMVKHPELFLQWDYGGAIALDAIFHTARDLDEPRLFPIVHDRLNHYQYDPSSIGYKILHDVKLPFDSAVGDNIGLFPITYLDRLIALNGRDPHYSNKSDAKIIEKVAFDYVLAYPYKLEDETFSRNEGWAGETNKNASFVWADDMYMGLVLISRLARHYERESLAVIVGHMAENFARHLQSSHDWLFYHGYNDADKKNSCCKWGRANGWAMMAFVEVLEAMDQFEDIRHSYRFEAVLNAYRRLAAGIARVQSKETGLWHQVLDNPMTYHETSCTAMFVTSMIRGMRHEFLERGYVEIVERGWHGLRSRVDSDGVVHGISVGTGIQTSVHDYEARPTDFERSSPGLGSVLHAAREVYLMTNHRPPPPA